jgi:hypothetical protein
MAAQGKHQQADSRLVRVLVTNGHRTSGGTGPGMVEIPLAEATLIEQHHHGRILGPAGSEGDPIAQARQRGVSN